MSKFNQTKANRERLGQMWDESPKEFKESVTRRDFMLGDWGEPIDDDKLSRTNNRRVVKLEDAEEIDMDDMEPTAEELSALEGVA